MVVLCFASCNHCCFLTSLYFFQERGTDAMVGINICSRARIYFHFACQHYHCHNKSSNLQLNYSVKSLISENFECHSLFFFNVDTRIKHHYGVYNGSSMARKTNSKCLLQDIWIYEHVTGYCISQ